jgi:hypothetical protein
MKIEGATGPLVRLLLMSYPAGFLYIFSPGIAFDSFRILESIIALLSHFCPGIYILTTRPPLLYPLSWSIGTPMSNAHLTFNWKFIPLHIFDSDMFSNTLIVLHLFTLLLFASKWLDMPSDSISKSWSLKSVLYDGIQPKKGVIRFGS